jgi:hypothetical protein
MAAKTPTSALGQLLASAGLPELGPGPRPNVLTQARLDEALKPILRGSALSGNSRDLIRGLVLLWHDHLDTAHVVAQEIETADGSLLHAIVHRREPDFSNSRYWFRRAGNHPASPEIAARASALFKSRNIAAPSAALIAEGNWSPYAFVDLCQAVVGRPSADPEVHLLRELQGIESEAFLDHLLGH